MLGEMENRKHLSSPEREQSAKEPDHPPQPGTGGAGNANRPAQKAELEKLLGVLGVQGLGGGVPHVGAEPLDQRADPRPTAARGP